LDPQIVRFCQKATSSEAQSLPVACHFSGGVPPVAEQGPGLAHHRLLNVQIGKLLEWTHFLWREFRDSLVNRDRFGQESVADEELRQPLKVFDA